MTVLLPQALRRRIEAEAALAYPNESCGFLLGQASDGTVRVEAVRPADNARADAPRNRYRIEPEEFLQAVHEADAAGRDVVGFYHSHPDAPAEPSGYDRENAWPSYAYLIVSVRGRVAGECRAWVLARERGEFEEQDIREGA